jgi:RimJ/RimL family protein N-acetyltransferase
VITYTEDTKIVKEFLTLPNVWRMSTDDSFKNVNPKLLFIPDINCKYILVHDVGLIVVLPFQEQIYNVHIGFKKASYGLATKYCLEALEWFWVNSDAIEVRTSIPSYNLLALRLANKIGMKQVGFERSNFIKDDIAYDSYIYKVNKEIICHH